MRDFREADVTDAVLARLDDMEDGRLKDIVAGAISHLHAFAREVELTPGELLEAARFLTEAGQISDQTRHEFLLLADTLGLTILVEAMYNRKPRGGTESSVLGPFYRTDAPVIQNGDDIDRTGSGIDPTVVHGTVTDLDGRPLAGALLDIWQSSSVGLYENQDPEQPDLNLRGRLHADDDGKYWFRTVRPSSYPIPGDGPGGELLRLCGRHNMRPGHIHFIVSADGFKPVTTQVFVEGDPYLDSDAVFGVKDSLVAEFAHNEKGEAAARWNIAAPFYEMTYDFVLEPGAGDATHGFSAGGSGD